LKFSLRRLTFLIRRALGLGFQNPKVKRLTESEVDSFLTDDPESVLESRELRAIGRITVQMAALELDLIRFLGALLFKSPNAGYAVFLGVNMKSLIEMLVQTFRLKVKGSLFNDDILSLASALTKINEERNSIVHGQWHYDNIQQRIFKARTRKGKPKKEEQLYYLETEKTSAAALEHFADLVILARKTVVRFYEKLLRDRLIAE
jgi:hypothetical protein